MDTDLAPEDFTPLLVSLAELQDDIQAFKEAVETMKVSAKACLKALEDQEAAP